MTIQPQETLLYSSFNEGIILFLCCKSELAVHSASTLRVYFILKKPIGIINDVINQRASSFSEIIIIDKSILLHMGQIKPSHIDCKHVRCVVKSPAIIEQFPIT